MTEPIGTQPIVHISSEALLKEVQEALGEITHKYPSVVFVTLVGPRSDPSALACITDVRGAALIDRLRNGLEQAKKETHRSRIHIPFRE